MEDAGNSSEFTDYEKNWEKILREEVPGLRIHAEAGVGVPVRDKIETAMLCQVLIGDKPLHDMQIYDFYCYTSFRKGYGGVMEAFFKENSHIPEFDTKQGGKIKNPHYEPNKPKLKVVQ